jgi:hypothetical protein
MGKQDKLDNGEIEKLLASLHSLATSHLGLLNVLQAAAHCIIALRCCQL